MIVHVYTEINSIHPCHTKVLMKYGLLSIIAYVCLMYHPLLTMQTNLTDSKAIFIQSLQSAFKSAIDPEKQSITIEQAIRTVDQSIRLLRKDVSLQNYTRKLEDNDGIRDIVTQCKHYFETSECKKYFKTTDQYIWIVVALNIIPAYIWLTQDLNKLSIAEKNSYKGLSNVIEIIAQWHSPDYYRILSLMEIAHYTNLQKKLPAKIVMSDLYGAHMHLTKSKPIICYLLSDALTCKKADGNSAKYNDFMTYLNNRWDDVLSDLRIIDTTDVAAKMKIDLNTTDDQGNTPLHWAITHNDLSMAFFLIPKVNVNIQNNKGDTPLHEAAKSGNSKLIQCLLNQKADVAILNKEQKQPSEYLLNAKQLYSTIN